MKRIHVYLLKLLGVSTFAACAGLFMVALPGVGVNAFAKLGAGGATAALGFVPYLFGELGQYMLPIGFLMAVVVTFGRLAADNEWLALTLSGMNPMRALWPTVLFAFALSAAHYPLAAYIGPDLKIKQREYLASALVSSMRSLRPGSPSLELGGFVLKSAERQGDVFYNATIYLPAGAMGRASARTVRASSIRLWVDENDVLHADLENPISLDGNEHFEGTRASLFFSAEELTGSRKEVRRKPQYLKTPELEQRIASGELSEKDLRIALFEIQNRRASSLAYVLFLIWGLPVGLMAQKRSMLSSFAITIGFSIVYYVLSIRFLREAGYTGSLSPEIAAWSTPVVGSLLGLLLWRKGLHPRRG